MSPSQSPYIDAEEQQVRPPSAVAESIREQVLSARGADSLREEAINDDGTARQWREVVSQFEGYIMTNHAANETWHEEKDLQRDPHRFTAWKARQYEGRIRGGLRYAYDDFDEEAPLKSVLLTRTGFPFDADGQPAPPVEFLQGLQQGRDAAMRVLRRDVLGGGGSPTVGEWGRVSVREHHREEERRAGYPHCHDGLLVVGNVTAEDFRPAIEAYVEANPFAREKDHPIQADGKDGAVTVYDVRQDPSFIETFGDELTNSLIGYSFDIERGSPLNGTTPAERRFASLMWATGRSSVTFGTTFREWIEGSQADWTPKEDGSDGDDSECQSPETFADGDGPPEKVEPDPTDVSFTFPDERNEDTEAEVPVE